MKKQFAIVLTLSLLLSTVSSIYAAPIQQEASVKEAVMQHFLPEDASSNMDEKITRAGFIDALARFEKAPSQDGQLIFSDIPQGADYEPSLVWAFENGLVQGISASEFAPDMQLTKEQAAVILERYFKWHGWTLETASQAPSFSDASLISDFAYDAVLSLCASGFFTECKAGTFQPQAPLSYAQAAGILLKLSDYEKKTLTEFMSFTAFDGYTLEGKLNLPANSSEIRKLVIFVNGSGPNTYNNRRTLGDEEFNYFDVFAEQLNQEGIAFLRTNTRGVSIGNTPPMFDQIEEEAYKTYTPQNVVQDHETIIASLKQDPRFEHTKIYLLGWSEGTMIAPAVAARGNVPVDGLLLAGYCNQTMDEILAWQNSGESSMIFYRQYFDYNEDGIVNQAEYEEDRYQLKEYLGATFEEIDQNQNGEIDAPDFEVMLRPFKTALYEAIDNRDDAWLKDNYSVRLTSNWFLAHRDFTPNRVTLPSLNLPVHIFHGTYDANVPVQQVYDIEKTFRELGKTNLTTHVYQKADHDLNYTNYLTTGELPEGFADIFETCAELDSQPEE